MKDDPSSSGPVCVFTIPGHRRKYHLSRLVPYYGTQFCERLSAGWTVAFRLVGFQTSESLFKSMRRALHAIALYGLQNPQSAEARILVGFRDETAYMPSNKDWHQVVMNLSGAILDVSNNSLIDSKNPKTRNGAIETLRLAIRYLVPQGLFPPNIEPTGRLEERLSSAPKCLATLSFEAGKLNTAGLSPDEAVKAFVQRNRDMLHEMKRLYWDDLLENERKFDEGQRLFADPLLPNILQIDDELRSHTLPEIKNDRAFKAFDKAQRWAIALKLEHAKLQGGKLKCGHKKIRSFLSLHFTHAQAQPYLESTITALNAVFHIILIESGANTQPLEDLPFSVYAGPARHGKRQLATTKNRAGGKRVSTAITDDLAFIALRSSDTLPSATAAVDIWFKLSASLRSPTGATANRFWVWRRVPGTKRILTQNPMINHDPWYKFLRRIAENPILGGVAITRKAIRKAVANSHLSTGDFDLVVQQALLGHVKSATTFSYLSEGAVRSFLVSQVREFMNAWEAASVINVEDAARKLGVTENELIRRQRLGLDNGLAFAALRGDDTLDGNASIGPSIAEEAKLLVVSDENIFSLEVARRALWAQFENIVNTNPLRFLRTWIPWMAIVEGYCERLENSRFRVRLKRIREEISTRLDSGSLSLPILW